MQKKPLRLLGSMGLVALGMGHARAAIDDYAFELVQPRVEKGQRTVEVRLIHRPDGKPVGDAVLFATRLDMAPDDMESMTSAIEPTQSPGPGLYRFRVDLTDEGRWRISLAAKIQGETGTLQSRLILQATP
ncbi:FixH family protein [Methylocystis parvus]|uniref:FixH family protein n=1 Tax=Methylocystis parvus TaxID=134 RepID=A0A6B8M9Y7_9HYPH|nr:FixH family protein [Methylocystis parvus]QGM97470.1 FixH family protein [Methylocystis parvus]WBJ98612.1 FixH family protein [Methylocystis parvus OBBP]